MTKKQKQEFLEIYKKSKSIPTGEGDGSHSTKPSDFSGAPKSDASVVVTPNEEVVKPLPCEIHVDQWLSTLSSADALGGVVVATMLHVDQHREKCALPFIPNACTCRPVSRKEIEETRRRSRLCSRNGTDCDLARLGARPTLGSGLTLLEKHGRVAPRCTLA